jgi:hypothetical protein
MRSANVSVSSSRQIPWDVRVRPGDLLAGLGHPAGVVARVLAEEQERLEGSSSLLSSAACSDSASRPSVTWTVPARRASSWIHGIGPSSVQSSLTVALSSWKRLSSRRCGLGQHPLEQRLAPGVGEDRALGGVLGAAGGAHADRPAAAHDDVGDRLAADDLAALGAQPATERVGDLLRAAARDRPAERLADADEHPAVQRAARGVRA